jgi:outer membrane protein
MNRNCLLLFVFFFPFLQITAQRVITIEEAIATTLQNNHDIRLSKNDSLVAALDYSFRNAVFQPRVTANAGIVLNNNEQKQKFSDGTERQRKGIRSDNLTGSVQLNWLLFDGMKMFATRDRLGELVKLGTLSIRNQVVQSVATVMAIYYQVVRQKQQMKAIAEQLQIGEERMKLAQFRLQNGAGNKPDVLQSQVDRNALRSAQLSLQLQLDQQKENLLRGMNVAANQPFDVTDSIPVNMALNYAEINATAEQENPGLLRLKKNMDIAQITLKERKAERLPVISFNSAYNYNKLNNKAVVNPFSPLFSRNNGFNFGLTASMPILDNQQNKRLTKQAALDIQFRQLAYENEKANISLAVLNAYKNYRAQTAILILEEENIIIARENLRIVQETYKLGATTFIQFRDAQKSLEEAQNRLIGVRYAAKLAETELLRLKGGW